MKDNLIITIGRENGSGGRYVGEKLAEALGMKCYDGELITQTAKISGLDQDYIRRYDEKPMSKMYFAGQAIPMQLFLEQSKVIEEIAERESCVIIGRCSDYVLRDFSNVVNVFIHAPLGDRIARVCKRDSLTVAKAEKIISQTDKQRANYYNFYTKQRWGESKSYHLSIDTSKIGIDGAVELIRNFTELRKKNAMVSE